MRSTYPANGVASSLGKETPIIHQPPKVQKARVKRPGPLLPVRAPAIRSHPPATRIGYGPRTPQENHETFGRGEEDDIGRRKGDYNLNAAIGT